MSRIEELIRGQFTKDSAMADVRAAVELAMQTIYADYVNHYNVPGYNRAVASCRQDG